MRVSSLSFGLAWAWGLAGCTGPEAADGAVCQDVIERLCAAPRCEDVSASLGVGDDCAEVLLARTGCGSENFAFTTPHRTRFLECRLPLLRGGRADSKLAPDCIDASQSFERCPDVVVFFGGTR